MPHISGQFHIQNFEVSAETKIYVQGARCEPTGNRIQRCVGYMYNDTWYIHMPAFLSYHICMLLTGTLKKWKHVLEYNSPDEENVVQLKRLKDDITEMKVKIDLVMKHFPNKD